MRQIRDCFKNNLRKLSKAKQRSFRTLCNGDNRMRFAKHKG